MIVLCLVIMVLHFWLVIMITRLLKQRSKSFCSHSPLCGDVQNVSNYKSNIEIVERTNAGLEVFKALQKISHSELGQKPYNTRY